jgi:hypothetical protein
MVGRDGWVWVGWVRWNGGAGKWVKWMGEVDGIGCSVVG